MRSLLSRNLLFKREQIHHEKAQASHKTHQNSEQWKQAKYRPHRLRVAAGLVDHITKGEHGHMDGQGDNETAQVIAEVKLMHTLKAQDGKKKIGDLK